VIIVNQLFKEVKNLSFFILTGGSNFEEINHI
jgi:hypothetical protein